MPAIIMNDTGVQQFDYSYEERKLNETWVDGKPIYRKCFTPFVVPNTGTTAKLVGVLPDNVESFVDLRCIVLRPNNTWYGELPHPQGRLQITNTILEFIVTVATWTGYILLPIIEYTKSTD